MKEKQATALESVKKDLPELPFTYVRVQNPEEGQYREWRVYPVYFENQENPPRTDEEIIESVKKQHEAKQWYTTEYWLKKGLPAEQIELTINGRSITVYNFNTEKPFSDKHVDSTVKVFQELAARFPEFLEKIRWILIDNVQPTSLLGDDELYPTNGKVAREQQAVIIMPRGMATFPHRLPKASNFEGTLVHETGHLIQAQFEDDWRKKFPWSYCFDNQEEWEIRKAQNGENRWFNKKTGEMSPQGQYPLQPEQCITNYAQQKPEEDICESLVAYIFEPERLRKVSPAKYAILASHDKKQKRPKVSVHRVAKSKISLPKREPATIRYYIEEPKEKRE